jgi:hypothetical protein
LEKTPRKRFIKLYRLCLATVPAECSVPQLEQVPCRGITDNTEAGIADLNGNVFEWNSGLRLQDGEIQILQNNDAADWSNPVNAESTLWKAILQDGTLVAPGTANTLKWDYVSSKITLSTTLTTQAGTSYGTQFESLGVADGVTVPMLLKALALHPAETGYNSDSVYITNSGERLLTRGGNWTAGASDGVFSLIASSARSTLNGYTGFRAAFCAL